MLQILYKMYSCVYCMKNSTDVDYMVCSKCKWAHYCSTDCQKSDWKGHKADCAPNHPKGQLIKAIKALRKIPAYMKVHLYMQTSIAYRCGRYPVIVFNSLEDANQFPSTVAAGEYSMVTTRCTCPLPEVEQDADEHRKLFFIYHNIVISINMDGIVTGSQDSPTHDIRVIHMSRMMHYTGHILTPREIAVILSHPCGHVVDVDAKEAVGKFIFDILCGVIFTDITDERTRKVKACKLMYKYDKCPIPKALHMFKHHGTSFTLSTVSYHITIK